MIVSKSLSGQRLDVALAEHEECNNLGLRARKRLCERKCVYVNGMQRDSKHKVFEGQKITIIDNQVQPELASLNILKEDDNFIAFFKESGVPTASLSGALDNSLEKAILEKYPDVVLLNRLDTLTSGIVLCAKHEDALEEWKDAQDYRKIKKKYHALVEGELDEEQSIKSKIDLSKNKVKALLIEDFDYARYTDVKPLSYENGNTLVECTIYKGVRHQIRAHLSSIGHPLVGDTLYGADENEKGFYLFHYKLESNLFSVECETKINS